MNDLASTMALEREIDRLVEALSPADAVRHGVATAQVVDKAGAINRAAILPYLPPLVARWHPSDSGGWPVPIPATVTRLMARASTPPSTGNATITLTVHAPGGGTATETLLILQGDSTSDAGIALDAPNGAWLTATVTTANGASGISIAAILRLL